MIVGSIMDDVVVAFYSRKGSFLIGIGSAVEGFGELGGCSGNCLGFVVGFALVLLLSWAWVVGGQAVAFGVVDEAVVNLALDWNF